jgi:predicted GNAT family acetyltransferase
MLPGPAAVAEPVSIVVTHEAGSGHAEARVDGVPAGSVWYRVAKGSDSPVWTVYSTVVDPAFGGRGVGSALVAEVMEQASVHAAAVVPTCWFVSGWLERHPHYRHLLADDLH